MAAKKKPKLAEIKTKPTALSVQSFMDAIPETQKRNDCLEILDIMKKASGEPPKIWGNAMVGFGEIIYESPATGRQVNWFKIGFAPRKANISLYLTVSIKEHGEALKKLGKHKTGAGCLYINKLEDIDVKILKGMIVAALKGKKAV